MVSGMVTMAFIRLQHQKHRNYSANPTSELLENSGHLTHHMAHMAFSALPYINNFCNNTEYNKWQLRGNFFV